MVEFRGRYRTAAGAERALRRFGAGSIEATIDTKFKRLSKAFAHRGDVVLVGGALGICIGAEAILIGREDEAGNPREGLVRFAADAWSIVWAVP